jgi:succinylglutamate desuccinylase
MDRLLGKIEGAEPGPLVICIAAVHGNEHIGLHAFRNVFSAIQNHNIPLKGKLLGIVGNKKATQSNQRFLDYDLNRCWNDEHINKVLNPDIGYSAEEDEELYELIHLLEEELKGDYTDTIIVDLHATSSDKGNFLVVPSAIATHPVIKAIKLPVVVNLVQYLNGTLLDYFHDKGFLSFAFEGGAIGTSESYHLHTSGLWELLDKAGAITHHDHEVEHHYLNQLIAVSESLPELVITKHRHEVRKGDGFHMLPGFHNFQPVKKGQQLAVDENGPIYCPDDGLIFLPLYQSTGDDGFFLVDEISESMLVNQLDLVK